MDEYISVEPNTNRTKAYKTAVTRIPAPSAREALQRLTTPFKQVWLEEVAPQPLNAERLLTLLAIVFGQLRARRVNQNFAGRPDLLRKTSPSGGARHPTEGYIFVRDVPHLAPGVYHFAVADNCLERIAEPLAAADWNRLFHGLLRAPFQIDHWHERNWSAALNYYLWSRRWQFFDTEEDYRAQQETAVQTLLEREGPPRPPRTIPEAEGMALASYQDLPEESLGKVMFRRSAAWTLPERELPQTELSSILWYGLQTIRQHRHLDIEANPLDLVLHERALQNLYIDVSRLVQHVILVATALKVHLHMTPAVRDSAINELLGLNPAEEQVLFTLTSG